MILTTSHQQDLEQYIAERMVQPMYFPPFSAAQKPTTLKQRYRGIYITDTSKPAWMETDGVWRYADGSAV